jgi:2-(3-amino-3-carboxypropyl)histidine synthase
MKTLFIESKYQGSIQVGKIKPDRLPKSIGLVTTVQFADGLGKIRDYLAKKNKKVLIAKGNQKYNGQILGCDVSAGEKIKSKVDAFLYIGIGRFHPIGLAIKTKKDVFCFNPVSSHFSKIGNKEVDKYKKSIKIKKIRCLSAENIGILVSTKPGQNNQKKALEIKSRLEKKGKRCCIFLFDTLNLNELENFPFIEFWINTACPRIEEDSNKVINFQDINM